MTIHFHRGDLPDGLDLGKRVAIAEGVGRAHGLHEEQHPVHDVPQPLEQSAQHVVQRLARGAGGVVVLGREVHLGDEE